MVDKVVETFGKIDILVNNAGIVFDREFEDIKYEETMDVFKINAIAPLFSKLVAPTIYHQYMSCDIVCIVACKKNNCIVKN